VQWCSASTSKVAKKVDYPDSVKPSSNFTPLEKSLADIATHLSDLLSNTSCSKSDFAKFYILIRRAFGGAATVVSGRHAHLENSWSAHPGVYVVRKKIRLIYMTRFSMSESQESYLDVPTPCLAD